MFARLGENYAINNKKHFTKWGCFTEEEIRKVFDFAYGMTYGADGEHRDHRSGGQLHRKAGERFINTFQGKLAEVAFHRESEKRGVKLPQPDFDMYELGEWDDADFEYKGKSISIKSAAHFSNLLLLETKDWDSRGVYLPNKKAYNYHILVRISPDGKGIMRTHELLYSNNASRENLWEKIKTERA